MKRKDDDLLRLAFGELDAEAARAVEAEADAADRRQIEAFRALREGLQHLPPPPPDGLSAERLRAAILDRELQARRKPAGWGPIVFAPFALAALAFGIVLPRMRPHPEPQIVVSTAADPASDLNASLKGFEPRAFDFSAAARSAPKPLAKVAAVPKASFEKREPVYRSRRQKRVVPPPVESDPRAEERLAIHLGSSPEEQEVPKPIVVAAMHEPQTIAPPPSTVVEAPVRGDAKTETVVIVSNQRDLETGALAAQEKEVGSVLVGG